MLWFVVPLMHHDCAEWPKIIRSLKVTLGSLAAQDSDNWSAVVVSNRGSGVTSVNPRINTIEVDIPAPARRPVASEIPSQEERFDVIRLDKGQKVLAGIQSMPEPEKFTHIMVVDGDDLISRKIVSLVAENKRSVGFYVRHGFVWRPEAFVAKKIANFHEVCGTSLILRKDLFSIDFSADGPFDISLIKRELGSHIYMKHRLDDLGYPLKEVPFPGAVYIVGSGHNVTEAEGPFTFPRALRDFASAPNWFLRTTQLNFKAIAESDFGYAVG